MTAYALNSSISTSSSCAEASGMKCYAGVNLDVANGELLGLMGPSGSGKSTLLNLIAGLDRPTTGEVIVAGDRLSAMDEAMIAKWRSSHIGFVFQFYHLIPVLTAFENVELPLLLFDMPASQAASAGAIDFGTGGIEAPDASSAGTDVGR